MSEHGKSNSITLKPDENTLATAKAIMDHALQLTTPDANKTGAMALLLTEANPQAAEIAEHNLEKMAKSQVQVPGNIQEAIKIVQGDIKYTKEAIHPVDDVRIEIAERAMPESAYRASDDRKKSELHELLVANRAAGEDMQGVLTHPEHFPTGNRNNAKAHVQAVELIKGQPAGIPKTAVHPRNADESVFVSPKDTKQVQGQTGSDRSRD